MVALIPDGMMSQYGDLRRRISEECRAKDIRFDTFWLERLKTRAGRPYNVLAVRDSQALYRMLHRKHAGILLPREVSVVVRRDPSCNPELDPRPMPIARFVRYKGWIAQASDNIASQMQDFLVWCSSDPKCANESDARCLPLHVFEAEESIDLDTSEGAEAFRRLYGPPSKRTDEQNLEWRSPKSARHGSEQLHVARRQLERGMHWDVQAPKGKTRLCTESEVWSILKGGYTNVFPDAFVRKSNTSKRVWPSKN